MADPLAADRLSWIRTFTGVRIAAPSAAPAGPSTPAFGPTPRPPPGPQPDPAVERVKADISAKFSVKIDARGGASWRADELKAVADAFDAIPAADKDALKDIEVDRVPTIDNDSTAAAVYQAGVDPTTTPATQIRQLRIANAAYLDTSSGVGQPLSAAEQKRKIVHEVGHVVAKRAQVDADFTAAKAAAKFNDAVAARDKVKDQQKTASETLTAAYTRFNQLSNEKPKDAAARAAHKAALAKADAEVKAAEAQAAAIDQDLAARRADVATASQALDAARAAAAATRVPQATVDAGQAQVDASGAAASNAASGAATATAQMSVQERKDSEDYRKASDLVANLLKAYADAIRAKQVGSNTDQRPPDTLDAALKRAIEARNRARAALQARSARNPALAAYAAVDRAQDDWAPKVQTQARLPNRSPKVQEFVDLVESNHLRPITPYAAQSWPAKPEEFFAEAYSIWVTDPNKLKSAARPLFDWFASGQYR